MIKICNKCLDELSLDNFYKSKTNKLGVKNICKKCTSDESSSYYQKNKDKILEQSRIYQQKNKDKIVITNKKWVLNNKEKISNYSKKYNDKEEIKHKKKEYYQKNKDKIKHKKKEYYQKNKDKILEQSRIYQQKNKDKIKHKKKEYYQKNKDKIFLRTKNRYKKDKNFKLSFIVRAVINQNIKKETNKRNIYYLGCSIEFYKNYLYSMFVKGMDWDNYGNIWEIDHIIPISSFNLGLEEERKKCFHYTNTMPRFKTTEIALLNNSLQIGNRNKFNKIL